AREGQKRQADEFLQRTAKKQKLAIFNVGDNVLISVPDVDRGRTDARNILAIIMEIKFGTTTQRLSSSAVIRNFSAASFTLENSAFARTQWRYMVLRPMSGDTFGHVRQPGARYLDAGIFLLKYTK
ncbi:unnamed protein product, partial [Didymodactylos carnosus]